jgi:hypothetical protein
MQVKELAPDMRPARRLLNGTIGIQRLEPALGIGLQDALIGLQMGLRMLTPPIRRIGQPDGRRVINPRRAIIPDIHP